MNMAMQNNHIVHVFFGQARKLSPLMAELQSLAGTFRQTLIIPEYDQDPEYLARRLPSVEIVFLRMRSRHWSARQTPLPKLFRFTEFCLRGMRAARRSDADLIVAHDMPAVLPLLGRLLLHPSRVLFNAHEMWTETAENIAPLRPLWRPLERWTMRRAGRVICPEPNRARIFHEEYGTPQPPAVVMNIPADPPPFERTNALRERLSLDDNTVIVLYQGLIAESRCVRELQHAVLSLPEHVHLVLIGIGEDAYMQQLREDARAASNRIHVFPWMNAEDLQRYTFSADVGVLLYRNRGRNNYFAAPNKLFEYLFAGLPVVSSSFPGLRSIVEKKDGYGACADPERPEDIARAIQEAVATSPGAAIAHRARTAWSWGAQSDILHRVYHQAIENAHAH